jgi:hypothetical protein
MSEISAWTFGLRRQTEEGSPVPKEFLKRLFITVTASMGQTAS